VRVVLVVNAHVSRIARHGPGKVAYNLARGLYDRDALGKVICYSADASVDIPRKYFLELELSRLIRLAFNACNRIGRILPHLSVRRIEERRFDRMAKRSLTQEWGNTVFCTKPVNPDTIAKAKQLGMLTVMSTSILHPQFNLARVTKEQQCQGASEPSVYTDRRRVAHLARAITSVDKIIAANSYFRDNYGGCGVAPEKFIFPDPERPHEGVDSGHYSPPVNGILREGQFQVLHVSHMTLIKGVQYLLAAWQKVEAEIDGELVLFGSLDANMRSVVRRSGAHKVRIKGPGNPIEDYRRAALFVSPSVSDAGPNTVFEAMACGTPAIVSSSCGVSQFIKDGVNGFTYRYDDTARLASLILDCYNQPSLRESVAREALATARRYPISDYTETWLTLLESIGPGAAHDARK
jgi:glycosyltransferase involved in cell wall biosynthesis